MCSYQERSSVTSLETDLRAPSGALQDALQECKRAAAAADTGAIKRVGMVFHSEYDILALIEPLNFQYCYQVFADVNAMFFLAECGVSTFSEAMTVSKAIKGADFPNMCMAKMNTSHIIGSPPIMGTKGKSGKIPKITCRVGCAPFMHTCWCTSRSTLTLNRNNFGNI